MSYKFLSVLALLTVYSISGHSKEFGETSYSYVNINEGIPVYSSENSEESDICGWLQGGSNIATLPTKNGFLELQILNSSLSNCGARAFIQDGFLTSNVYVGPTARRTTQKWKSQIPNFSTRCRERREGDKIIISFVEDVLLHGALQSQAYRSKDGFRSLWKNIEHIFQSADFSYANLEGPAAEGVNCRGQAGKSTRMQLGPECRKSASSVYTSYPMFNYHPRIISDLKKSGVDIVSTANNHSLDRYSTGIDKTIEALNSNRLPYTGTRKSGTDSPFYRITTIRGHRGDRFKIAWLACTFSANGFKDRKNQLLNCYQYGSNGSPIFSRINQNVLSIVRGLKARSDIDGIIVTPHWGPTEYVHSVHSSQLNLGKELLEAGATAVIGAHPHVLQPWEVYKTRDGREGFIHYSLGNFVSNQRQTARRASMVLLIGFQKTYKGLSIDGVRYVPMYFDSVNTRTRGLIPLDANTQLYSHGKDSLRNIDSLFPKELRLNSSANLTTCR